MATVPTQIRIDEKVKADAVELLDELGLDLSAAVNIYLRQIIIRNGIPFDISVPRYKQEVLDAAEEARSISRDPNVKGYTDLDEFFKELDD